MNNKNYSGKDTVPFKVNPFKINSSRKEKKKKKKPHLRYFPTPIFLVPSVRKFVEKEKKGGGEEGIRNSKLSFLKIYLIPEVSTQRLQSQTAKRIIVGARSECVTALVRGMPCSVAT